MVALVIFDIPIPAVEAVFAPVPLARTFTSVRPNCCNSGATRMKKSPLKNFKKALVPHGFLETIGYIDEQNRCPKARKPGSIRPGPSVRHFHIIEFLTAQGAVCKERF
jgi:hypothetical protein